MDTVLGVSMASDTVRVVLVEGEDGGGVTVDQDDFQVAEQPTSLTAPDQVVAAILGTREGAAEGGYRLRSTGVTWADPADAAALHDALAAHKVENVMLVSAFMAAAALAQSVGNATGYARTGLLFVEPTSATLAVVDSADGSISDVYRQPLAERDGEAVTQMAGMVAEAGSLESQPNGLFVVGSDGIDVAAIKPHLQAATRLPVSTAEERQAALARGAALASAHAPLFASSTAALGYARDPGTGEVLFPDVPVPNDATSDLEIAAPPEHLAYAAVDDDDDADSFTIAGAEAADFYPGDQPQPTQSRKAFLTAMAVLTVFVVGVVALMLALAISIRPHVRQRPEPGPRIVVPAQQAPPAPPSQVPQAPAPSAIPAPAPAAPAPGPPPPAGPPPLPQLPLPAPPAGPPGPFPGPRLPLPGPGPGIPGPGPGLPGPRVPVPGPGLPHVPVPHLPGIPGL